MSTDEINDQLNERKLINEKKKKNKREREEKI